MSITLCLSIVICLFKKSIPNFRLTFTNYLSQLYFLFVIYYINLLISHKLFSKSLWLYDLIWQNYDNSYQLLIIYNMCIYTYEQANLNVPWRTLSFCSHFYKHIHRYEYSQNIYLYNKFNLIHQSIFDFYSLFFVHKSCHLLLWLLKLLSVIYYFDC